MRGLLFLLSILFGINAQAQIVIDNAAPYNSTTHLLNNVLLGGGIVVSNPSFIGDPDQIGFFNGINSNVGIDSGIILSTGDIYDIVGPNNSPGGFYTNFSGSGDATLDAIISPDDTYDAAVLEFDFVPTSGTISFRYVFASEEYLEYVNSYNDAFGFFITATNPAGGAYVDQNIAIVPGTANTPVTINNVNNVTNSAYYIDNGTGEDNGWFWPSYDPQYTDPTVIQFDGLTTPLTAVANVNCGETYHIKLVVADAVDPYWDSGIFLEAGSFISPEVSVNNTLGLDTNILAIACNTTIDLTTTGSVGSIFEWFDDNSNFISSNATINVGPGIYVVSATIDGCTILGDTIEVLFEIPAALTGLACYETATLNATTCAWDVTGFQDPIPTGLDCWETANFDTLSCSWIVTGTQDTDSASNEAWVNQLGNGGATAALNHNYLTLPLTQGDTLMQLDYSISWKNHGWGNSSSASNAKINLYNNNTLVTTLVTIFENNAANAAIYHIYAGSISLNLPISMGYNVKVELMLRIGVVTLGNPG